MRFYKLPATRFEFSKKEKFEKNHNISEKLNISKKIPIFSSKSWKTSKIASKMCKQKMQAKISEATGIDSSEMTVVIGN